MPPLRDLMPDPSHPGTPYEIPAAGSLGLLALGYRGLLAWREVRGTEWIEQRRVAIEAMETESERSAPPKLTPPDEALEGLEIVVVSGLPRSGTSMLMQMLVAGGLSPFTDGERTADESNPRGYYEHDRVRALARDSEWVVEAGGLVVKVVAPLLPHLPAGPTYRVLYLDRDLDEVIQSQAVMLKREGHASASEDLLRATYQRLQAQALGWIRRTEKAQGLAIGHADVLANPEKEAARVADFLRPLHPSLDPSVMADVVDPTLHRQRSRA